MNPNLRHESLAPRSWALPCIEAVRLADASKSLATATLSRDCA